MRRSDSAELRNRVSERWRLTVAIEGSMSTNAVEATTMMARITAIAKSRYAIRFNLQSRKYQIRQAVPNRSAFRTHLICKGVVSLKPSATMTLCHLAFQPFSLVVTFRSMASAIFPNSVFMAVPTTMARARPLVI